LIFSFGVYKYQIGYYIIPFVSGDIVNGISNYVAVKSIKNYGKIKGKEY